MAYDKHRDKSILKEKYENKDNDLSDDNNLSTTKCDHNHVSPEIIDVNVDKESQNYNLLDNGKETRQEIIENVVEYDKDLYKPNGSKSNYMLAIDNASKIKQQTSESKDDYEMSKEAHELAPLQEDQEPLNNIAEQTYDQVNNKTMGTRNRYMSKHREKVKDDLRLGALESTNKQLSIPVKDEQEPVDLKFPFNNADSEINELSETKEKKNNKPVLRFKSFRKEIKSKRFNNDNSDETQDGYEVVNTNYLSNDTTNPRQQSPRNRNRGVLKFKSFQKKTIQKRFKEDEVADSKYGTKNSAEEMTDDNGKTKIKTTKKITIKSGYKNNDLDEIKEEQMKDRYGVKSEEEMDETIDSSDHDVPSDSNEIIEESVETDYSRDRSDGKDLLDNVESNDLAIAKEPHTIKNSIISKEDSKTIDSNHLTESIYSMNHKENYDHANQKFFKEKFEATDSKIPQNLFKAPDKRKKKFRVIKTTIVQNSYNNRIEDEEDKQEYVDNSDNTLSDLQGSYVNDSLVERLEKDKYESDDSNETENIEENYRNGGFKPYGEDEQENNHKRKKKHKIMVVKSGYEYNNLDNAEEKKSNKYDENSVKSVNQDSYNSLASKQSTNNDSELRKELIKEALKKHLASSKKKEEKSSTSDKLIHFKKKGIENKNNYDKRSYMNVDVSYLQSKDSNFNKELTSRYKRDLNGESDDDLKTLMFDDYEAPVAFKA